MRLGFQRKEREEKADLTLEGATYLADSNKELEAVNEFLRSLKANPGLKGYFKDISLVSIERKPQENITLTAFNILCKADPEERK
jgi:hypothetical protein